NQVIDPSFDLVLSHEKLPHVTYCMEWCPSMYKDAALLTLELQLELLGSGYTLVDAHPWNIVFRGTKPCFVDVTSIVKNTDKMLWTAYGNFISFFKYPLYFYFSGKSELVKFSLLNYLEGVTANSALKLLGGRDYIKNPGWAFDITLNGLISRHYDRS